MKPLQHVIVRARSPHRPLVRHAECAWLWEKLRELFPDALSASLMPNHYHLEVFGDPDEVVRVLGALMSGFTRRFHPKHQHVWWVEPARVIGDPAEAARVARYQLLNPCRARLTADPLEHPWTTHRDVMGAVADPWVTPERLAVAIGWPCDERFRDAWHAYVSGDPSVAVGSTPPPEPAERRAGPIYTLDEVARAAAAATRKPVDDVGKRGETRRIFVQLARDQGWTDAAQLAEVCGSARRSVQRIWAENRRDGVAAAALCLGDRRLLGERRLRPGR